MKKIVKTTLAVFAALCLTGGFAFANGSQQSGGSSSGAPAAKASSGAKIVINLWTHEDPNRQKMEEGFAKEWMAQHPNIVINYTVYPSTKIQDLIPTAYAAKNAPSIWNMELQKAYPLYAQGLVAPIPVKELGYADEAALKDTYLPHMLDPVTDTDNKLGNGAGKIYGLPLEMVNFCMYVNKKMLKAAGVADPDKDYPKTWEDVLALTKKIVKHNGEIITRRGFDFRYPDYLISWVPMVEQLGGKVISDDGKEAIVGKDAWVKCLQFMKDWGPTGLNLGSPTLPEARKQFDNDKDEIAMHLSGFYQEARMRTANPTFFNSKDWEVIPYPVWKGGKHISNTYYFQYYMVNSQIPKAEQVECWKFIHFMLSHGEDYLKNVALTQPTKQVFDGAYFKSQPYSQVFRDDLKYAHCVYFSSFSWQINEAITQTIANIMSDPKLTADAAYTQLKKACQDIVDQNS